MADHTLKAQHVSRGSNEIVSREEVAASSLARLQRVVCVSEGPIGLSPTNVHRHEPGSERKGDLRGALRTA
ncbi:hypothetical protein BDQ12DRAFT_678123 [Crucibulum laeve]|uniref:Uncharacterized protein n=1 Tax=Crucibulum laeve TaxID=68775 RepID=A0A5C3M809_9AGAR|nr:hypothetical protein BDQ12DRAFT_678123 [Crucibulum laeve]